MNNEQDLKIELKQDIATLKQLLIENITNLKQEIIAKEDELYNLIDKMDT